MYISYLPRQFSVFPLKALNCSEVRSEATLARREHYTVFFLLSHDAAQTVQKFQCFRFCKASTYESYNYAKQESHFPRLCLIDTIFSTSSSTHPHATQILMSACDRKYSNYPSHSYIQPASSFKLTEMSRVKNNLFFAFSTAWSVDFISRNYAKLQCPVSTTSLST